MTLKNEQERERIWKQHRERFSLSVNAEVYASLTHFDKEEGPYFSLSGEDLDACTFLAPVDDVSKPYKIVQPSADDVRSSRRPIPEVIGFRREHEFPWHWIEEKTETHQRRCLEELGREFAKLINRAFVDVLTHSLTEEGELHYSDGPFDAFLAKAEDELTRTERSFRDYRFLFPRHLKARLLQQKMIVPDKNSGRRRYAGRTTTGQVAFWYDELPEDTALLFDSSIGVMLAQDETINYRDPYRLRSTLLGGIYWLNWIVLQKGGVIVLKGIEKAVDSGSRATSASSSASNAGEVFVNQQRIDELRAVTSRTYALKKLIAMCEELNRCWVEECYYAVAMLTRSILDHVPPIFGYTTFAQVANSYGGTKSLKSFKECMRNLDNSSRKVADMHLHTQARAKESLLTPTQVDARQLLDVLLGEVVAILQPPQT